MQYHIVVYGCQMNVADAERISAVLEGMGYEKESKIDAADLVVVIMCSVRQPAVDRIFGLIEKLKKIKNKPTTILTGCILKKDKKTFSNFFDFILDIKNLSDLPKLLKSKKTGLKLPKSYLDITPLNFDKSSAFLPISTGCNNFCSYCVVPYTRGRLVCRDHNKIIKEAKRLIKKGVKNIWLLGQNVNDYSSPTDPSVDFSKLLQIINNIKGDFKIFFTSPHPKNFSPKLIKTLAKLEKFSRYLNLPVQSGDNEILKKMNRCYTIEKYIALVKKIRQAMPNINLSTDVIVGFPGETKKQFENTVKLFKKIKFNVAYISKYSPRRQTTAWDMKDDVPFKEKKRRERVLQNIIKNEK